MMAEGSLDWDPSRCDVGTRRQVLCYPVALADRKWTWSRGAFGGSGRRLADGQVRRVPGRRLGYHRFEGLALVDVVVLPARQHYQAPRLAGVRV